MPDLTPVTDPALLDQLNASVPPLTAADPETAAKLDQMAAPAPTLTLSDRFKSLMGDPDAQKKVLDASTAALRNSPAGGIAYGLREPFDQIRTMAARGLQSIFPPSGTPGTESPPLASALGLSGNEVGDWATRQAQDAAASQSAAQQNYEQNWRQGAPPELDFGRLAGNALAMAPLAYAVPGALAAGLPARVAAGGIGGLMSGGAQSVDPNAPDYWSQVAKNAAAGTLGGAAVPGIFGALGSVVSPAASTAPDIQLLRSIGVNPTPGELLGPTASRYEQIAANVLPGAGDFIKNARRATIEEFNKGMINQALNPIGESLEGGAVGNAAIGQMQDKIGKAYDAVRPQLGWQTGSPASAKLGGDLATLQANVAATFPSKYVAEFGEDIDRLVNSRMSPGGGITGESFHEAKSDLGKLAIGKFTPNSDFWDKKLGGAYFQAQQIMRDAQGVADPQAAQALQNVDNAFAQGLRVSNAGGRLAGEPGMFTPRQFLGATRALDPSMRKNAFAAGDALMQDYATAATRTLGDTVPNSGTPLGHVVSGLGILGAGVAGHEMGVPLPYLAGAAGLGAGTAALYSPSGRAALTRLLTARPAIAQPLAAGVRTLAPAGSAAFAPAWGALAGP